MCECHSTALYKCRHTGGNYQQDVSTAVLDSQVRTQHLKMERGRQQSAVAGPPTSVRDEEALPQPPDAQSICRSRVPRLHCNVRCTIIETRLL